MEATANNTSQAALSTGFRQFCHTNTTILCSNFRKRDTNIFLTNKHSDITLYCNKLHTTTRYLKPVNRAKMQKMSVP